MANFGARLTACVAVVALLAASVDAGRTAFKNAETDTSPAGQMNEMAAMVAGLLMLGGGSHSSAHQGLSSFLDLAKTHIEKLQAETLNPGSELSGLNAALHPTFPQLIDPTDVNISPFGFVSKVLARFPDQVALDHFAANYTHAFTGVSVSPLTVFNYAPCIFSNVPYGVDIGNTAINISPNIFYTTPEGVNIEPEGVSIAPTLIYVGPLGENVQPQGIQVAPVLIAVAPIRHAVSGGGVSIAPTGIAFAGGKKK